MLNFHDLSYCLASDPTTSYKFEDVRYEELPGDLKTELNGLLELDNDQKKQLQELLESEIRPKPW